MGRIQKEYQTDKTHVQMLSKKGQGKTQESWPRGPRGDWAPTCHANGNTRQLEITLLMGSPENNGYCSRKDKSKNWDTICKRQRVRGEDAPAEDPRRHTRPMWLLRGGRADRRLQKALPFNNFEMRSASKSPSVSWRRQRITVQVTHSRSTRTWD